MKKAKPVGHLRVPRQGYNPDVRLRAKTVPSAKKVASKRACRGRAVVES